MPPSTARSPSTARRSRWRCGRNLVDGETIGCTPVADGVSDRHIQRSCGAWLGSDLHSPAPSVSRASFVPTLDRRSGLMRKRPGLPASSMAPPSQEVALAQLDGEGGARRRSSASRCPRRSAGSRSRWGSDKGHDHGLTCLVKLESAMSDRSSFTNAGRSSTIWRRLAKPVPASSTASSTSVQQAIAARNAW